MVCGVHHREQLNRFRPRFTVRSLMVVVAVAGLISSVAVYQQRLKGWARYHEARYLEQISPITQTSSIPGGMVQSIRLLDGTWTVPHTKTPLAEWHDHEKWEYKVRINQINFLLRASIFLLLASYAGMVIVWLVRRAFSTKIRRAKAGNRLVLEGDPHGRSERS